MYNKPTSLANSLDGSLLVAVLTIIGEKEREIEEGETEGDI